MHHPLPWSVKYWQRFPDWHEKSMPMIVDANGDTVTEMPQRMGHPGVYDEVSDETAHQIVDAVNATMPKRKQVSITDICLLLRIEPPPDGSVQFAESRLHNGEINKFYITDNYKILIEDWNDGEVTFARMLDTFEAGHFAEAGTRFIKDKTNERLLELFEMFDSPLDTEDNG